MLDIVTRRVYFENLIKRELVDLSGLAEKELQSDSAFKELNFDSRLLAQMCSALQTVFKMNITTRDLLDNYPTIAEMAGHLDSVLAAGLFEPERLSTDAGEPARLDQLLECAASLRQYQSVGLPITQWIAGNATGVVENGPQGMVSSDWLMPTRNVTWAKDMAHSDRLRHAIAMLGVLISRYTGQSEVQIALPVQVDTVGWLPAVLAVGVHCSPERMLGAIEDELNLFCKTAIHCQIEGLWQELDAFRTVLVRRSSEQPNVALRLFVDQTSGVDDQPESNNTLALHPDTSTNIPVAIFGADKFRSTDFDLVLELHAISGGIRTRWHGNADWVDSASLHRLNEHFFELLASAEAQASTSVGELPIISGEEVQQRLINWNPAPQATTETRHFIAGFERHVSRYPDAPAASFENTRLSYAELNERANRLAHYLMDNGFTVGVMAGICMERSLDTLVAMLGVLKSGAALVPMDPSYPIDRMMHVLRDSGAKYVLTEKKLAGMFNSEGVSVGVMSEMEALLYSCSRDNPSVVIHADNTAYVLFTSGSTGRPKGVRVTHRNLVNFLISMQSEPGISKHDVVLAHTTVAFDIAYLELFLPLFSGASLHMVSRTVAVDPFQLTGQLNKVGVSFIQATPGFWQMMIDVDWKPEIAVKALVGGEASSSSLVQGILDRVDELWNMYGPTETTIWSTCKRLTVSTAPITIGRPIRNTRVYILHELAHVPTGVTGELCIAGDGVTAGYLNRAELNAERFVDDPFGPGRLYRTGDRARYLDDGDIEVLGRVDNQVKVRGYRIELGDIDTAVAALPEVTRTVTILETRHSNNPSDHRLATYYVGSTFSDNNSISKQLSKKLPAYMVPDVYLRMESLPLTANRKIDRSALPLISAKAAESEIKTPKNSREQQVADIWAHVLGEERVSTDCSFFECGGTSLSAVRLVGELEKQLGWSVALVSIFQGLTISDLCAENDISQDIATCVGQQKYQSRICRHIAESTAKVVFFMVGSNPGYRSAATTISQVSQVYQLDAYALQSSLLDSGQKACRTIEQLASGLISEMLKVQPVGPYRVGGGCEGAMIAYEIAHQLTAAGETISDLFVWGTGAPGPCINAEFDGSTLKRLWWQFNGMRSKGSLTDIGFRGYAKLIRHEFVEYTLFSAMLKYQPINPLPSDMNLATLDLSGDDPPRNDPFIGWGEHVKGSINLSSLPGNHDTWLLNHVAEFGEYLRTHLQSSSELLNHSDL